MIPRKHSSWTLRGYETFMHGANPCHINSITLITHERHGISRGFRFLL
nr:MAG TPA: hypothetical protein [Bacteriophage sp.]